MKSLLLFLSSVWLLLSCNNSAKVESASMAKNSDIVQQNLKGKVKEFDEVSFTIDSTGASKQDSLININQFDEKGYQPKYLTKDSTGKIHTEQTAMHDENGMFTEMVTMTDGKQTFKLTTEFKDGKYTGGKSYDSTG